MPTTFSPLWSTELPAAWPAAPSPWSVSRLKDVEACALRVALRTANYSAIWGRRGYPPRFALPAFVGEVVHAAVEHVVESLRGHGCSSTGDPAAIEVISKLGGFTRLAEEAVAQVFARHSDNPRIAAHRDNAERAVRSHIPEIRRRIQSLLCGMQIGARRATPRGKVVRGLGPLSVGVYSEVWLEAPELDCAGRADQIVVAEGGAEITDFKTGEPDPTHWFQLQVYALLWTRDRRLNPSGNRPSSLRLRYLNRSQEVPVPSVPEMEKLAGELDSRRNRAIAAINARPPVAKFEAAECRRCDVRHLCSEYWRALEKSENRARLDEWGDVEVTVLGRHGDFSFDARIERAHGITSGKRALIRLQDSRELRKGDCLRVLDASLAINDDNEKDLVLIVRISALTEIFRVAGEY